MMIQATPTKAIDAKALAGAAGAAKSNAKGEALGADVESLLEGLDFANELSASLAGEMEVKAIEVSPDQILPMPSSLINSNPQPGSVDVISPKVFDPSLTQGVEKLIQPQTTEVPVDVEVENLLQLAKGEVQDEMKKEVAQALLKTPQIQTQGSRSPAIDFAQTEIDPQLMNMEDFVLQKNMMNKKGAQPLNGYGMMKPEVQKNALETGLLQSQVVAETSAAESGTSASVNSQQFILGLMGAEAQESQANETQAPQKVFDMSQVKTENSSKIMNQISDYIVQAKAAKEPTVNMRVNHEQLGMLDITVTKSPVAGVQHDAVAINIGTHSADGKNFFQQNSKELFAHLSNSGINVSDIKVETPSQTAKNDFDMGQQGRQGGAGAEKHFGSEQNQRRHESERRQELWDLFKDKDAA